MDERWRNIWNLEVPSVTKLFLWKAGNNLLATKENLFKRKVVVDKSCPVCNAESETIMHALWVCPVANDIWAEAGGCVQKWERTEEEFMVLWEKLMEKLSMEKLEEMAVLLRRAWLCRNEFVFEKKLGCPKQAVKTAIEGLLDYKAAQTLTKPVVKGQNNNKRRFMRWEKPESGWVKVNLDASLNLKERRMGVGIIIRDEQGEALVAVCDQKANVDSPVVAECLALRMAIELCSELNIQKAILEGDARVVIRAVQNLEEESSGFGSLIHDVKFFFQNRLHWKIQFAYREKNTVAHILVKSALALLEKTVWIEDVPEFVERSLDRDKSCIT